MCRSKAKYPAIHVIGLSSFNQQSFVGKMMESGASGYVLNNATLEELMERCSEETISEFRSIIEFPRLYKCTNTRDHTQGKRSSFPDSRWTYKQ